jgi:hypothetical protein
MRSILFLLVVSTAIHSGLVLAQDASPAKTKKQKAASPNAATTTSAKPNPLALFSQDPLDPSVEELPGKFKGHSCIEIANRYKAFNTKKDEFETTSAYIQRIEHVRSEPLYGKLNGTSVLGFSPERPMLVKNYNADTETMDVEYLALGSRSVKVNSNFVMSAAINTKNTISDEYEAVNGFGRKVTVNRIRQDVCAITFANVSSITNTNLPPRYFSFKLSPDAARDAKENMAVLYVVTSSAPYVTSYGGYAAPTIDSPTELIFSGDTIVVRLSEIWLFNQVSGRIYTKTSM